MSTRRLLETAVEIGQKDVKPIMFTVADALTEVMAIPEKHWSKNERKLVKVQQAMDADARLVNVARAIQAGGIHKNGLPRMGVATYKMSLEDKRLYVQVHNSGFVRFGTSRNLSKYNSIAAYPAHTLPTKKRRLGWLFSGGYPVQGVTSVPVVPPRMRPAVRKPKKTIVLFEVAEWKVLPVPGDPFLLEQVAGDVYAVLDSWDLTQLEVNVFNASREIGLR